MALRATIHKADLHVADSDRHYYGSHSLTIAKHPSETDERMMIRIIAFALQAHEDLVFTKGLSDTDEPDLWIKDLTDQIKLWIEVGQPDERRITRACGRAERVTVYTYGHAVPIWWSGLERKLQRLQRLTIWQIPHDQSQALAALAQRAMQWQVSVQDGQVWISAGDNAVTLTPQALKRSDL